METEWIYGVWKKENLNIQVPHQNVPEIKPQAKQMRPDFLKQTKKRRNKKNGIVKVLCA